MTSRRRTLLAACGLLAALAVPTTADARPSSPCKGKLCKTYRADTPSCWRFESRSRVSKCFIARAARHFDQPLGRAYAIAHRESRFNWRVTNASSGAAGLYQFMPRTWASTPYRHHSPYHPKWAALGAMWMWNRGGYSHWSL
jgi:hypothetical protein